MEPTAFKTAARIQQSILSPLEKRTLRWFAERMPAWINSDHLTLLGFVGMILTGVSFYLSRWNPWMLLVAIVCLTINWFGDSLDGTLARYRQRQRPRYGFYVDHIVDAFGAVCLFGGIGLSGYMSASVAALLLIAYFLLCIEIYLAAYALGVFRLSFGLFGPTELRVLLAIGNVTLLVKPRVHIAGNSFLLYDVGATVAICGMIVMAAISAVRNTIRLYNEERLP
ncbi:MAG TPA: CDP-alcohol phosphatidyltransferase family protein [Terriglobia bacterium]|nr:CDP-alcohol phosphatidyltransferase family protein [Terriglobia bacterium]